MSRPFQHVFKRKVVRDLSWSISGRHLLGSSTKGFPILEDSFCQKVHSESIEWLKKLDENPEHLLIFLSNHSGMFRLGYYLEGLMQYWLRYAPCMQTHAFCHRISLNNNQGFLKFGILCKPSIGFPQFVQSDQQQINESVPVAIHLESAIKFFLDITPDYQEDGKLRIYGPFLFESFVQRIREIKDDLVLLEEPKYAAHLLELLNTNPQETPNIYSAAIIRGAIYHRWDKFFFPNTHPLPLDFPPAPEAPYISPDHSRGFWIHLEPTDPEQNKRNLAQFIHELLARQDGVHSRDTTTNLDLVRIAPLNKHHWLSPNVARRRKSEQDSILIVDGQMEICIPACRAYTFDEFFQHVNVFFDNLSAFHVAIFTRATDTEAPTLQDNENEDIWVERARGFILDPSWSPHKLVHASRRYADFEHVFDRVIHRPTHDEIVDAFENHLCNDNNAHLQLYKRVRLGETPPPPKAEINKIIHNFIQAATPITPSTTSPGLPSASSKKQLKKNAMKSAGSSQSSLRSDMYRLFTLYFLSFRFHAEISALQQQLQLPNPYLPGDVLVDAFFAAYERCPAQKHAIQLWHAIVDGYTRARTEFKFVTEQKRMRMKQTLAVSMPVDPAREERTQQLEQYLQREMFPAEQRERVRREIVREVFEKTMACESIYDWGGRLLDGDARDNGDGVWWELGALLKLWKCVNEEKPVEDTALFSEEEGMLLLQKLVDLMADMYVEYDKNPAVSKHSFVIRISQQATGLLEMIIATTSGFEQSHKKETEESSSMMGQSLWNEFPVSVSGKFNALDEILDSHVRRELQSYGANFGTVGREDDGFDLTRMLGSVIALLALCGHPSGAEGVSVLASEWLGVDSPAALNLNCMLLGLFSHLKFFYPKRAAGVSINIFHALPYHPKAASEKHRVLQQNNNEGSSPFSPQVEDGAIGEVDFSWLKFRDARGSPFFKDELSNRDKNGGTVYTVSTLEELCEVNDYLADHVNFSLCGIDMEWRPRLTPDAPKSPVLVLQLCLPTLDVIVLDLATLLYEFIHPIHTGAQQSQDAEKASCDGNRQGDVVITCECRDRVRAVDTFFARILNPRNYALVGFEPAGDFTLLRDSYAHILPSLRQSIDNIYDLKLLYMVNNSNYLFNNNNANSLSKVVANCFEHQLSKTEQCSDWLARPLTQSQLAYAAGDAFSTLLCSGKLLLPSEQSSQLLRSTMEDSLRKLMLPVDGGLSSEERIAALNMASNWLLQQMEKPRAFTESAITRFPPLEDGDYYYSQTISPEEGVIWKLCQEFLSQNPQGNKYSFSQTRTKEDDTSDPVGTGLLFSGKEVRMDLKNRGLSEDRWKSAGETERKSDGLCMVDHGGEKVEAQMMKTIVIKTHGRRAGEDSGSVYVVPELVVCMLPLDCSVDLANVAQTSGASRCTVLSGDLLPSVWGYFRGSVGPFGGRPLLGDGGMKVLFLLDGRVGQECDWVLVGGGELNCEVLVRPTELVAALDAQLFNIAMYDK